jgi:uncharacterized protein (PEP-CTERM system associated)
MEVERSVALHCACLVVCGAPSFALAQSVALTPVVSLASRFSDNVFLAQHEAARRSHVLDVSAGALLEGRGTKGIASIDFRLQQLYYRLPASQAATQRFLNASIRRDLWDEHLTVAARAEISRQQRSAFDGLAEAEVPDTARARLERRSLNLTPAMNVDGSELWFRANGDFVTSRREGDSGDDRRSLTTRTSLRSNPAAGGLGWSAEHVYRRFEGADFGERHSDQLRFGVVYAPSSAFSMIVSAGREKSSLNGPDDTSAVHGMGVQWAPDERTQLAVAGGRRFFGNEFSVAAAHRFPRFAIRYSASRDVGYLTQISASNATSETARMLGDLLANAIPDPVARSAAVLRRMEDGGSITRLAGGQDDAPSLTTRQQLATLYLGIRLTGSLSAGLRKQSSLDLPAMASAPINQDFSQRTAATHWSYRLTRRSTLNYGFDYLKTESLTLALPVTQQRLHRIGLQHRLGPSTVLAIDARRSQLRSTVVPSYTENSVSCSLSVRL